MKLRYLFPVAALTIAAIAIYSIAHAGDIVFTGGCRVHNVSAVAAVAPNWNATTSVPPALDCSGPPPPPPVGCQTIKSATTGIANFTRWTGTQTLHFCSTGCARGVDVTRFDSVYGAYPGQYGLIATASLPTNKYWSMQFTPPANYMTAPNAPNPLYGAYSGGETGNAANFSMTISTGCGDFSNPAVDATSTVVPGCWKNRMWTKGLLQWNAKGTSCVLRGGQTYYLNIVNADVSKVQPNGGGTAASTKTTGCSSSACSLPITDGPGSWSGYVPK